MPDRGGSTDGRFLPVMTRLGETASNKPAAILWRRANSTPAEDASEKAQAGIRLALLVLVSAYVAIASVTISPTRSLEPWAISILGCFVAFGSVAVGLFWSVSRYPGHYPARRLFSMAFDYAALAFCIIAGGKAMLPIYALVIWVTVGNGLRFGSRYMVVAAIMAQVTLAVITAFTTYWQQDPALVLTFSLTALVVPAYTRTLLHDIEQARRDAEEANTAKSRFLAQASHDLRQPVHAIGLFLNSLTQTGLAADQRAIVDRIDRSLQGVAELFRSLLDISTLDSGAVTPNPEVVSVARLFRTLEQQNHAAAQWAGTRMRFAAGKDHVVADRALLLTMLQNLLSNAIKYAPRARILVGCRPHGGTVSIWVVDTGPGIPADHLPRLFDEFYRVRRAGDADIQGAGLGLSIVKRLAALTGLRVELRSRPGRGTGAAIHGLLPAAVPPSPPMSDTDGVARPLTGLRILLVEDNMDVLDATADLLRSWGGDVTARSTVPSRAIPCDLILTDFDIGGGRTGADCLALYRGAKPPPMAIVMTGHDESTIDDAIGNHGGLILKKPVRPAELRSAIATLRRRHGRLGAP